MWPELVLAYGFVGEIDCWRGRGEERETTLFIKQDEESFFQL
jgi:hypothetical protein